MKKKRYTNSPKRKERDLKQVNWENRLEVMRLRSQGWTFEAIGEKIGLTKQRAIKIGEATEKLYKELEFKTIEELEQLAKKYE